MRISIRRRRASRVAATSLALATLVVAAPRAGAQDTLDVAAAYTKTSYEIPMRDGVKLFTLVYAPRDTTKRYPILLRRTPYSIGPYEMDRYPRVIGPSPEFDRAGYIFVLQDVRGKFRSEGEFVVLKPYVRDKRATGATDESSDAYDTIDWLLSHVPGNNGRVGMYGVSYDAWQTVMGMIDAHPALRAASPQASPNDIWRGDDFYHNGAFRLMYAFSWLSGNARSRTGVTTERGARFDYGTPDGYDFFLRTGTVARIDSMYFQGRVPSWNDLTRHPNRDAYWQSRTVAKDLDRVPASLPVLNVAGWFDAEDFYGPMAIYSALERAHPTNNRSTLVVGPWLHGGWMRMDGDELGNIRFGEKTGVTFRREIQFPFFERHLRGVPSPELPEAWVFETGANAWRRYDSWPPKGAVEGTLVLRPGGRLALETAGSRVSSLGSSGAVRNDDVSRPRNRDDPRPETRNPGFDEYISDPAKPVPFTMEPRTTQGHLWMVEDQRFAAARPDVLVYETEPLAEDVTLAGPITASLDVSTTGTDGDWVVKLIDVYPGNAPDNVPNPAGVRMGGFQMLVAGDVMRAKYRDDPANPKPLTPGRTTRLEIALHDKLHTFKKGHRIMVQVQSSWFPVIDRNPQTFVDIMTATDADFRKATQRVWRTSEVKVRVVRATVP